MIGDLLAKQYCCQALGCCNGLQDSGFETVVHHVDAERPWLGRDVQIPVGPGDDASGAIYGDEWGQELRGGKPEGAGPPRGAEEAEPRAQPEAEPRAQPEPAKPDDGAQDPPQNGARPGGAADGEPPDFAGRWAHKGDYALVEVIRGDLILGPDGTQTRILERSGDGFSIAFGGQTHRTRLDGCELRWDDGDVWVPVEVINAFDGRWRHKADPTLVEVIRGLKITGPDGTSASATAHSKEVFVVEFGGKKYKVRRVGNELVWDDGDVWILEPPVLDAFKGYWVHKNNPELCENINGETIVGPGGGPVPIVAMDASQIHIRLHGQMHSATLVQGQLFWDDGDVWIRREAVAKAEASSPGAPGSPPGTPVGGAVWSKVPGSGSSKGSPAPGVVHAQTVLPPRRKELVVPQLPGFQKATSASPKASPRPPTSPAVYADAEELLGQKEMSEEEEQMLWIAQVRQAAREREESIEALQGSKSGAAAKVAEAVEVQAPA